MHDTDDGDDADNFNAHDFYDPDNCDDLTEQPESPQSEWGFRGLLLSAPATGTAQNAKAFGYMAWSDHDRAEFNRQGCTDPLRAVVLTAVAPALQMTLRRHLALGDSDGDGDGDGDSEPDIEEGSITGSWFTADVSRFIGPYPGTWQLQVHLGEWHSEVVIIEIVAA
jgi:hypothetical protein